MTVVSTFEDVRSPGPDEGRSCFHCNRRAVLLATRVTKWPSSEGREPTVRSSYVAYCRLHAVEAGAVPEEVSS